MGYREGNSKDGVEKGGEDMKDISYTILQLQELYEQYDKECLKKHSTYYGLASEMHYTAEKFLAWLKERELGLTRLDVVPQ